MKLKLVHLNHPRSFQIIATKGNSRRSTTWKSLILLHVRPQKRRLRNEFSHLHRDNERDSPWHLFTQKGRFLGHRLTHLRRRLTGRYYFQRKLHVITAYFLVRSHLAQIFHIWAVILNTHLRFLRVSHAVILQTRSLRRGRVPGQNRCVTCCLYA